MQGTGLGWLPRRFHGCRWRYGNHGSVLLPRLQDLWDPPAQPAFTSPFVHHCMQRLKTASPCRTAESHGLGATLVVLKKGRPSWPTGGRGVDRRTQHRNGSCGCCWRLTSSMHRAGLASIVCTLRIQLAEPIPRTHEQPRPRTPVEAPAPSLQPGQRLVLVVSRVWPTEGPAFLLLAALDRQTQPSTQYHLSPHTYRAYRLSALLFLPSHPLPFSPARKPDLHSTAPDAQQPAQCLYVACCTLST